VKKRRLLLRENSQRVSNSWKWNKLLDDVVDAPSVKRLDDWLEDVEI